MKELSIQHARELSIQIWTRLAETGWTKEQLADNELPWMRDYVSCCPLCEYFLLNFNVCAQCPLCSCLNGMSSFRSWQFENDSKERKKKHAKAILDKIQEWEPTGEKK